MNALDTYSLVAMERTLEEVPASVRPTLLLIIGAYKSLPARRLELEARFYSIAGLVAK